LRLKGDLLKRPLKVDWPHDVNNEERKRAGSGRLVNELAAF
jgi:hypothetical protein